MRLVYAHPKKAQAPVLALLPVRVLPQSALGKAAAYALNHWPALGRYAQAGWRSAVIYSVIGICHRLGVNPQRYLAWVLPKLATATTRTAVNP